MLLMMYYLFRRFTSWLLRLGSAMGSITFGTSYLAHSGSFLQELLPVFSLLGFGFCELWERALRNQVQLLMQVQWYLLNFIKFKKIGAGRCQNQAVCTGKHVQRAQMKKTKEETTEQAKTLENTRATIEILQTPSAETVDLYLLRGSYGYLTPWAILIRHMVCCKRNPTDCTS